MAKVAYDVAYRDHQYLWAIGSAYDMTGGYVDQDDLKRMLKTPTKTMAAKCLSNQINYWFQSGTEQGVNQQVEGLLETDPMVRAIYERHVETLSDADDD